MTRKIVMFGGEWEERSAEAGNRRYGDDQIRDLLDLLPAIGPPGQGEKEAVRAFQPRITTLARASCRITIAPC